VVDVGMDAMQNPGSSLRAAVADALSRLARDQAQLIALLVAFDRSGEWALDGARSCAHWIADRADLELSTIREWLRIGHRLAGLHEIAARFNSGKLSYSKVRALVRVATRDNEHDLCEIADRVPAADFARAVAEWLQRHESSDDTKRRERAATALRWRGEPDGMVAVWLRLPPESFARLQAAVESVVVDTQRDHRASADADSSRSAAKWPSLAQQRADALLALVTGGGALISTEVVFHVRGDGCTLDNGMPIAESVIEQMVPGAFLRALIHDALRNPINASGRHRHPTTRQKRVVKERDRNCVDCGSPDLLQYDHTPPFEVSRRTVIEELELRCAPCHHRRHGPAGRKAA
jgi:hypothetical protein